MNMIQTGPIVNAFAVLGGVLVGGFSAGFLTQLLARSFTTRKAPQPVVVGARATGGLLVGLILYLLLFGTGSGGFGGQGLGLGEGKGQPTPKDSRETKKSTSKETHGIAKLDEGTTLRIEVLGQTPLKTIHKGETYDAKQRYRIQNEPLPLLTLEGVRELVGKRVRAEKPLRMVRIILYQDSPAEKALAVDRLKRVLRETMKESNQGNVNVDIMNDNAPAP